MPRTIDDGFRDFLSTLTPSSTETEAAKNHRASIKTRLEKDFGYVRRFTRIGSFGNGTSISGFSDVDYLAVLPTNQLTRTSSYSLTKVRNSLDGRFPFTGVHVDCPAVVVPFGSSASETTEIVPADLVDETGAYPVYEIADGADGWMRASPDAHKAYVAAVDEKHGGKVKPLIRFIKAWKCYRDVPISSFYLELRIAKYAASESGIVYDIDVKRVLAQLRDTNLASMQDPMGVSGYIAACSTDAKRADALSKLNTAATRAENARDAAAANNVKLAFDWWRFLYADAFPTYYW